MMLGHPCNECAYFVKPNWWTRWTLKQFAERCSHPEERDQIDGGPTPCITVRIQDCNGINKFKPISSPVSEPV